MTRQGKPKGKGKSNTRHAQGGKLSHEKRRKRTRTEGELRNPLIGFCILTKAGTTMEKRNVLLADRHNIGEKTTLEDSKQICT